MILMSDEVILIVNYVNNIFGGLFIITNLLRLFHLLFPEYKIASSHLHWMFCNKKKEIQSLQALLPLLHVLINLTLH